MKSETANLTQNLNKQVCLFYMNLLLTKQLTITDKGTGYKQLTSCTSVNYKIHLYYDTNYVSIYFRCP